MKKHRYNIFPEMLPDDYSRLLSDLRENGYDDKQPIYTYEGDILDGWNRYNACNELSIVPSIKQFFGDEIAAIQFVMRTNKRRNLTSSQWAAIAVEADEIIEMLRAAVERERRAKQIQNAVNQYSQACDNKLTQGKPERVTTKLAETFNTNRTYVNDAAKLRQSKPEIFEQVKRGEKTLTEVKKEEKIQLRSELIEQQKRDILENKLPALTGLYDIISIDPPWNYGREYDPESSRVANPYPEMSVQQIKELTLPFRENAILFLWTTHKFLPEAFEIVKYWGFEYKATIVWNKEKIGMGAWFRMQCEFCLFAIKGSPTWINTTERDIINESRREHSRKPDAFFAMVDKICIGRKLEYFAREDRYGWDVFGNDTNKF